MLDNARTRYELALKEGMQIKMAQTFIKHTEKTRNSKTASLIAYCVC